MIGILSDAHGNGRAFDLALSLLRREGADRFYYLGDAVGYIPSPGVVRSLRTMGGDVICLRGNHEDMLLNGVSNPTRDEVYGIGAVGACFTPAEKDFIAAWPMIADLESPAGHAVMVHANPHDYIRKYIHPDTDLAPYADIDADYIFMGHTHRPFIREHAGKVFVNVGSCGLPRDRGDCGAAALFDEKTGDVRILRFDIADATRRTLEDEKLSVHSSVRDMFERKENDIFGEFIR